MSKTALEKSHSKSSNALLTFICFFNLISISILWIGLAILKSYQAYGYIILIVGIVLTLLSSLLLTKFSRG